MSRFKDAIDVILAQEGGYSNDSEDPGGETQWGISKRSYPSINIRELSRAQAIEIYREIMENRPPPTLVAPREDEPESGTPTANELQDMIRAQIRSINDTLSFATTAKLRFDRLEANRSVIVPPTESP